MMMRFGPENGLSIAGICFFRLLDG